MKQDMYSELAQWATPGFCEAAKEKGLTVDMIKKDIPKIKEYLQNFKAASIQSFTLAKIGGGPGLLVVIDEHPNPIDIEDIIFNDLVRSNKIPWLWLVTVLDYKPG